MKNKKTTLIKMSVGILLLGFTVMFSSQAKANYAATLNYTCPSGGILSGTTCTVTSTYGIKANTVWSCSTHTLSDTQYSSVTPGQDIFSDGEYKLATDASCNESYEEFYKGKWSVLSTFGPGAFYSCFHACGFENTSTSSIAYSCSSGDSLSGSTCTHTSSYAAIPNYSCNTGDTLSGTTCTTPISGSCGADNTQYLTSTPTNLCTTGTASPISGTGPWSWTCGTAACSANIAYECYNVCSYTDNPWNYAGANFQATDAACTTPTPTSSVTYSQNCACGPKLADLPGVTPTFASLCAPVTNGSCDSTTDYGKAFTPPAQPTNLCSTGTPSALTTTSSGWTWSCNGSNGGTNATSCYATQNNPINAQCGSDNGQTVSNPTNLCNPGAASTPSGSGPWTWTCSGINGGNSASCSAQKQATLQPSGWKEVTP